MAKSQQKTIAIHDKPQITLKSGKVADKVSAKIVEPDDAPSKATKKIADAAKKSAGDSKQSMILALLMRPAGATLEEMAKATGWQRHSVHGMMSGVLRKRLGLTITSGKEEHGRVYRITGSVSRL